jgi:hypothetical protein
VFYSTNGGVISSVTDFSCHEKTAGSRRLPIVVAMLDDDWNEATGLLPRARVVLRNRARGSRQLIVAQSAEDILDWVFDPGVRDVIAMRHVG